MTGNHSAKEVSYIKSADLEAAYSFKGQFIESYTSGKFNTPHYRFEVDQGRNLLALTGCKSLNDELRNALPGVWYEVKFEGKQDAPGSPTGYKYVWKVKEISGPGTGDGPTPMSDERRALEDAPF